MHAFNFQHVEYKRPFLSKTIIILILKLPKLVDSWSLVLRRICQKNSAQNIFKHTALVLKHLCTLLG